jgi:hypothetical protein
MSDYVPSVAEQLRQVARLSGGSPCGIWLTKTFLLEMANELEPDYRLRDPTRDATMFYRVPGETFEAVGDNTPYGLKYRFVPMAWADRMTWEDAYALGYRAPQHLPPAIMMHLIEMELVAK